MNEVLPCVCSFVSGFAPLISVLIFHLQGFCAINEIKDKQMHIAYFSQEKKSVQMDSIRSCARSELDSWFCGICCTLVKGLICPSFDG